MLGESVFIRYQQSLGLSAELTDEHYQGHYVGEIAQQLRDQYGDQLLDRPIAFFGDYAKNIISIQQRASLARVGITHDIYFNEASLYQDGRLHHVKHLLENVGQCPNDEQIGDGGNPFFADFLKKNIQLQRQFFVLLGVGIA